MVTIPPFDLDSPDDEFKAYIESFGIDYQQLLEDAGKNLIEFLPKPSEGTK